MFGLSKLAKMFTFFSTPKQMVRQSLNYVWIDNPNTIPRSADEIPLSTLPPRYLDRAIENAERYPDAQVQIWIDKKKMNPQSQFFIASHIYISDASNICIRDLTK